MRFVLYTVLAIVGLLAGAAAFLYVALPTDFVRDELASEVLARTGRTLTVAGPISISIYPEAAVTLTDVSLSPPAGMNGEPTLAMHSLSLKVPLWPLFQHQLKIERFAVDHPVLVLRTDAQGRKSWDFRMDSGTQPQLRGSDTTQGAAPPVVAAPNSPAVAPAPRHVASFQGVQLRDVQITSGTIHLVDDRTGLNELLTDVTLKLGLEDVDGPAHLEGVLTWSGEPTTVEGAIGPVSNLLSGDPASIDLAISGHLAKSAIKGTFAQQNATPLSGNIQTSAGSLRALLAWLKRPLPAGSGFGPVTLSADFGLSTNGLATRNAILGLDGMTAKGSFSVTRGKDKPMLRADLSLDRLDLNIYAAHEAAKPAAAAAPGSAPSKLGATDELTANESGWSTAPIDLSALRLADADVTLTAGALQWQAIKAGKTVVKSSLRDGLLKNRFSEIELYGGKGSGSANLEATAGGAKIESNFALHGIQARPFLTGAMGFDRIAGRGDVAFNFSGTGRNQLDLVKSLMGQGRIELADGAIVGVNVAAGIKALQSGQFGGWDSEPSAKTDFSALTASSTITNGVLDNRDLVVTAPLLRLAGAGTANLPSRTMDYTVQTALVDSTEGQGAADVSGPAGAGLTFPVRVQGPWANPAFSLDLKSLAKNPGAVLDTVKKAASKFAGTKQGKAIGDLLGGLLGQITKQNDPSADPAPAQ